MPQDDLIRHGTHVLTVCNACRYCEQYCPVFPAMENRVSFAAADLNYLANLCHNCGECLYACQYAPPHEFGIDVPRTLARIRARSYAQYCWPQPMAAAFTRSSAVTSVALVSVLAGAMFLAVLQNGALPEPSPGSADFYTVVPHGTMIGLFGSAFLFACLSLLIGLARLWRDIGVGAPRPRMSAAAIRMLRDVASLRYLHSDGISCVSSEEARTPWRRWFHHCTSYGFMLCFASTSVAAIYHVLFGWKAPYSYASLPVILGTAGGLGLLVGPIGLFVLRGRRDPALTDPAQNGADESFIGLLLLTSVTGLALLVFRQESIMPPLLIVHLAAVLALFLTLPYGKFVHGIYRAAALLNYALESLERR